MRALKKKKALSRRILCWKGFFATLFLVLITPSFVLAQSSIIDEMWQKWAGKDDPNKIERFLNEIKGLKDQLEVNDITYAINLAFNGIYNRNRPKELLVWHQLAGDMYLGHPNMQSNTLFHYQQALLLTEKLNNLPEKISTLLRIAELYRTLGLPERAYTYAIDAEKLCKNPANEAKIPQVSDYLYKIADHYILVGKRGHANKSFKFAIQKDRFSSEYTKIYAFNNWGVNNIAMEKHYTALHIFGQGITFAQQKGIKVWVGIMTGNQGWIYFKMNELDRAKKLLDYDLKVCSTLDTNSAAGSAQLLAEIALRQENPQRAFEMLKFSNILAPSIAHTPKNIHLWASTHAMINNWAEAYRYSIMADQEEERRGKLKIEQEKRLFNNLTHFLDQENALKQQSSQMAFEKKQAHNRILFLIMVFLLSIGVGASFFWRAKRLSLKNEAQFRLELQELKIQLEQYQKEFEQHRVEPNVDTGFIQRQRTAALNQQLQRTKLLTEQEWRTFKLSFEQIYPDFLQKINTHSAQFTPAEVRLLTLSKLGLKSPEIAEILGISMDGVKKGRQRLKKKLLAHSEELELIDLIS